MSHFEGGEGRQNENFHFYSFTLPARAAAPAKSRLYQRLGNEIVNQTFRSFFPNFTGSKMLNKSSIFDRSRISVVLSRNSATCLNYKRTVAGITDNSSASYPTLVQFGAAHSVTHV